MKCKECNGSGKIVLAYDKLSHSSVVCGKCNGKGDLRGHIEDLEHLIEQFEYQYRLLAESFDRDIAGLYYDKELQLCWRGYLHCARVNKVI